MKLDPPAFGHTVLEHSLLVIFLLLEKLYHMIRASTKGRNLAFLPVEAFLKPVFVRVHFVLRPVQSYILAIFWYFLGPTYAAAHLY